MGILSNDDYQNHPELREGEVYVENTAWSLAIYLGFCEDNNFGRFTHRNQVRLGNKAYFLKGKEMGGEWRPVFVLKGEIKKGFFVKSEKIEIKSAIDFDCEIFLGEKDGVIHRVLTIGCQTLTFEEWGYIKENKNHSLRKSHSEKTQKECALIYKSSEYLFELLANK